LNLNASRCLKYLSTHTHLTMTVVLVDPIDAVFFLFGRQRSMGHLHWSANINSLRAKTIAHTIINGNCGQNNIIILCFSLFNCFHLSSSSSSGYTRVKYYVICRRDLPGVVCKYQISRRQFTPRAACVVFLHVRINTTTNAMYEYLPKWHYNNNVLRWV